MNKVMMLAAGMAALGLPVAAIAQGFPLAVVEFAGGPDQLVVLEGPMIVAYDAEDNPLFKAERNFLFGPDSKLGNPDGRAFAWDLVRKKVRISAASKPQVWVACSEIKTMSIACSTNLRVANDGSLIISGLGADGGKRGSEPFEVDAAGAARLPVCPGDRRCP
ncbi:MAG: hypothetical protein EAY70_07110 [Sphingomonadales bacterium]|nr:MAG: hypothetical protein EAY70_07110 [Sphingomonadales bacterium]